MVFAPGAAQPLLTLEALHKTYPGQATPILDGVSLTLDAGEFVAIMGESGTGKSTLLNLIAGLDRPDSGRIILAGQDLGALQDDALTRLRRARIGFIFQAFHVLPYLTALQNVALPLDLLDVARNQRGQRASTALASCGVGELAARYPRELSGGQRQRVGVARALAGDPPVLLMDEPFGALDPLTRAEIQREFHALQKRLQKTIIFVTHDMREALLLGTRIALLESGKLVGVFTPDEFLRAPDANAAAYVAAFRTDDGKSNL